jgi:hypothetical protein
MKTKTLYSSTKPSLTLDFANTKRLDPRVTFARATSAAYYDGVTIAKAEENLASLSEDFGDAYWSLNKTNITVTINTQTAPDGTSSADVLTDDATNGSHRIIGTLSALLGGVTHTFSVYAKKGTHDFIYIGFRDGGTSNRYIAAAFNIDTGTAGDTFNPRSAQGGVLVGSSITSVGNGWYRCSVTGSLDGTTNNTPNIIIGMSNAATGISLGGFLSQSYIGTGTTVYVWGAQLEARSSITSYTATSAPVTRFVPVLQTANAGVARFTHNPLTNESLGLLVESQRTNLLLQSETFGTTWSVTRGTVQSNDRVAPSGALTADTLVATTDNNTHFLSQTFTGTAAAHTFSVYAKASGYNHVALRLFNGTTQVGLAYYNLSTGATGTVTAGTASIQHVGNNWYRCMLTATLAASASCTADIYLANADNSNSFAGNDWNGVPLWGAQVEAGAFETSYIPTTTGTVTRNADNVSMTGTSFSSWFTENAGTLFADITPRELADTSGVQVNDNTTTSRTRLATSSTSVQGQVTKDGVAQATLDGGTPAANTRMKLALAYQQNDFSLSLDGQTVATDTSGSPPIVTQLQIGAQTTTTGNLSIRKFAFYPVRLTNAQLQTLTKL